MDIKLTGARLWVILFLAVGMMSCKKDRRQQLLIMHEFVDFTIQPGLNNIDTHIYTFSPKFSTLQSRLAQAGYTLDDVVSIEGRRATLSGVFGDVDLDFIHRVSLLIYDPSNPQNRQEFFYMDPVPFKSKTEIDLFPGISNINEWLERDYFGLELRLNFRQISPSLIAMRLEYEVQVMGE